MTEVQRKRIHDIEYSCDSRAELAERIVRLEDERDKLRKERDYLLMNSSPTATELRRVRRAWKKDRDENAKLRELVRDMWDFYCVVPDEPHACKEEIDFSIGVWKCMRELGIEVD